MISKFINITGEMVVTKNKWLFPVMIKLFEIISCFISWLQSFKDFLSYLLCEDQVWSLLKKKSSLEMATFLEQHFLVFKPGSEYFRNSELWPYISSGEER